MKWISFCQERLCSRCFEMLACLTACLWEELCVTTQTILGFHMTSPKIQTKFLLWCGITPEGEGGTRYILGWGGVARPLIP